MHTNFNISSKNKNNVIVKRFFNICYRFIIKKNFENEFLRLIECSMHCLQFYKMYKLKEKIFVAICKGKKLIKKIVIFFYLLLISEYLLRVYKKKNSLSVYMIHKGIF